ncbi:STAS/SEC14 domain-containing protein [Roseovarius tibetensis]|uniref:STAS/SEC14 domain-containing protein n=1 Tax=Roseovarius tibetensis TaxID=2685897 RepID=UPI003D7F37B6
MIEIEHGRQGDSLLIRVIGKVSRRDVDLAAPEIDNALELAHAPLNLLIRLEDFEGWEIGGLWEDMTFGMQHRNAFGRIAVIGEGTLEKWRAALAAPFGGSELRFFPQEHEDAAREWLGMAPGGGAEAADDTP